MSKPQLREKRGDSFARQLVAFGNVGIMFPVSIGIGFAAGYYLDRWLTTTPWFALGGFALGAAAALRNLLRSAAALERAEQQDPHPTTKERRQQRRTAPPPDADD